MFVWSSAVCHLKVWFERNGLVKMVLFGQLVRFWFCYFWLSCLKQLVLDIGMVVVGMICFTVWFGLGCFVVVLGHHLLLLLPHQLVRLLHLLQSSKSLLLVVRLENQSLTHYTPQPLLQWQITSMKCWLARISLSTPHGQRSPQPLLQLQ